jgi:hypothetical protein
MFGIFKSKEQSEKEAKVTEIGKMLFGQIAVVGDKAKAGRIDKSIFDQRINSMFAAGYLIGYVLMSICDGVSTGRYEVREYLTSAEYTPNKLERYLSTGQIG